MVKKKAPVIPLTIVCIGIAVAFGVNTQMHPKDPDEMKKEQQQEAQQSTTKPPDKKEDLKAAMDKSGVGDKAPVGRSRPEGPKLQPGGPMKSGSLMTAKKQEPYHPKPSATSTDGEWYVKR